MVCQHMLAQMCHFPAFQMNHLSTLLAFAMKAYMLMTMLIMSQILEACTAGAVYHIIWQPRPCSTIRSSWRYTVVVPIETPLYF